MDSICNNNINIFKLIIDYADKQNIILNINDKNERGNSLIFVAIVESVNNSEYVKLIIDYANKQNIILNINDKNKKGYSNTFAATANNVNNSEVVKLLMNYADDHNIILNINEKCNVGWSPLIGTISSNNIESFKLIMDYANKHNIILDINEKDENGWFPILYASEKKVNNSEFVKLLMDYADDHNIKLKINEKNRNGDSSLIWFISNNNVEAVKLLFDYANKYNIIMDLKENQIGNSINYINNEIIELIIQNKSCRKLNIEFSKNSILLKKLGCYYEKSNKMADNKRKTKKEFLKLKKEKNKLENELYEMKICQFKEKLRNLIKNVENNEIIEEDYYEWKIENFSNIQNHKSSPEFEILNHKWKIEINVCKEGIINFKLKSMDALYLSANKFIYANCVFAIRNNNDFSCYKASCSYHKFGKNEPEIVLNDFINNKNLKIKHENGITSLLENDSFINGIYIRIYRNDINEERLPTYMESISIQQSSQN